MNAEEVARLAVSVSLWIAWAHLAYRRIREGREG